MNQETDSGSPPKKGKHRKVAVLMNVKGQPIPEVEEMAAKIRNHMPAAKLIIVSIPWHHDQRSYNRKQSYQEFLEKSADYVLHLNKNHGYAAALNEGLEIALGFGNTTIATICCGAKYYPHYLPRAIKRMQSTDAHMVLASRYLPKSPVVIEEMGDRRTVVNRMTQELYDRFGVRVTDPFAKVRVFSEELAWELLERQDGLKRIERKHTFFATTVYALMTGHVVREVEHPLFGITDPDRKFEPPARTVGKFIFEIEQVLSKKAQTAQA